MRDPNTNMVPGPQDVTSALALANAVTIAAGVIRGIASKSIADSVNGSPMVQETLAQMSCTRIVKNLQDRHNEARRLRLNGYN